MPGSHGWINCCIIDIKRNALKSNVNISKNQAADMLTSSGLSAGLTLFQRLRKPESLRPLSAFKGYKHINFHSLLYAAAPTTSSRRSRTTGEVPEDVIKSSTMFKNLRLAVSAIKTSEQLRDMIAHNCLMSLVRIDICSMNKNVPGRPIAERVVHHIFHEFE
jgi:hypothetical protein